MGKLVTLCLFSVVTVGLPSQASILVGAGGLPTIQDALAIAAPGDIVAVHASTGLGTFPIPGLFEQPSALDLTNFWFVGLYVTDATGQASVTWNMPAGLYVDAPLWLEAIGIGAAFPWQIAPVVGGIVR